MCKPICCVITWLLFFIFSISTISLSTSLLLINYFPNARFENPPSSSLSSSENLDTLETMSLFLAGTGLFLSYLQFKVKLLLCFWITVFVFAEIEIFVLILLDAAENLNVRSIIHVLSVGFSIYSLAIVYAKCRTLKYCSIQDSTCQEQPQQ